MPPRRKPTVTVATKQMAFVHSMLDEMPTSRGGNDESFAAAAPVVPQARAAGDASGARKISKQRPSPPGARIWRRYHALIRGTSAVILALIAWEMIGRYALTSKLTFAPLSAVLTEFAHLWGTGELERHMLVSFTALALGFLIAAVAGIAIGSLTGVSDAVGEHLDPLINALYATPLVALSPILILALGIGPLSKVAIVFMLAVFPILINTNAGIKSADEHLIEAARSFAATRFDIFYRVLLPSALPFIIAGFRLGIGRGLIGIFIGEMFGAQQGLGYLISVSAQTFDVPGMFVGVLVLATAGVLCTAVFQYIERRIAPWRHFDLKV